MPIKTTLLIKPATVPAQVLLGLTSGNILRFPNFFPKNNAEVSQIQTERNIARVTLNPRSGRFLNSDNDPNISPNQTNAKMRTEMFNSGLSSLRNISNIMAVSVSPTINR